VAGVGGGRGGAVAARGRGGVWRGGAVAGVGRGGAGAALLEGRGGAVAGGGRGGAATELEGRWGGACEQQEQNRNNQRIEAARIRLVWQGHISHFVFGF